MKLWLTQCLGGRCMLTALKPNIAPVRGLKAPKDGVQVFDAFERPGEPINVRHLCENGVTALFGEVPPYLEPVRVEIKASYIKREI